MGWRDRAVPVTDSPPSPVASAPSPAPPEAVAYAAEDVTPERAARAIDVSDQAGVSPTFFADDLEEALRGKDRADFVTQLQTSPKLSAWAARSSMHAAAVQKDAAPLAATEGWLDAIGGGVAAGAVDLAYSESARETMNHSGPLAKYTEPLEAWLQSYDSESHGFVAKTARVAPQMAAYAAAGYLAGPVGLAALLYTQNKGALARQIWLSQFPDRDPLRPAPGLDKSKTITPEQANTYATVGSAAVAVTMAGLLTPLIRSIPGGQNALQRVGLGVAQRAISTTAGQAAVRALAGWGAHTLQGATAMAMQGAINDVTAAKATGGGVDLDQVARESASRFVQALPVMATFAAYGPARNFLEDRGRIVEASTDAAKLKELTDLANSVQLKEHSPNLAADLFGSLGAAGQRVYINYRAVRASAKVQAVIEAHQPGAVAAAEVSQGSAAVPLEDYLTHLSGEHEGLADDVALKADGMTPREARETDSGLRKAMDPEDAKALLGKLTPDELREHDQPKAAAEEPPAPPAPPAEKDPAVEGPNPLHEVMATEYGGTPDEWAKKLTPELMAALSEERSTGAVSPEEHAARVVEALPINDIDPEPFRRIAARKAKDIQKMAEQTVTGSAAGAKRSSPKDVAMLSVHEMARDVNLAKAAKAEAVKAEMDKAQTFLSKQAVNQKLRASLNKSAPPLLRLFDALTEGTTLSPSRQGWATAYQEGVDRGVMGKNPELAPGSADATAYADAQMSNALDGARQWFDENAQPYQFDEGMLQAFLAKPKPWGELRPAEARNISDAVKQLAVTAREQNVVRTKDAEAAKDEIVATIRGELQQNPDKGLPLPSGIPSTWTERRLLDANAANALMLRPKNNLRQKSAAAVKWVFDNIQGAAYQRDDLFRDVGELHQQAWDAMPKEIAARRYETYDLSDKLPVPPNSVQPYTAVPRQWIWKLARHWGSMGNIDRVVSTSGWDRSALSEILFDNPATKLTVPEWDYMQKLGDINDQYVWPKLKAHFEKYYGMAPPKVAAAPFKVQLEDGTWKEYAGSYEPLKRDARPGVAPQAEPTRGIAQYWGRDFQTPWVPGAAKERIDNSHYLVNMDWDSTPAVLSQTLHWLAFDQPVRNVAKLLNDQGLAADMNRYMGEARADATRQWLKSAATRQTDSIPNSMNTVARAFGWQRKLALMQIIGGSPRLALTQLSHPIGLMAGGEVNPVHGLPALLSTVKPLSLENGEVRLFPNWNDAMSDFDEVQHRADNAYSSLRQQWDAIGQKGNQGPIGALKGVAMRTAGLYLHAVDRLTTTWAAEAFRNQGIANGLDGEELKAYVNSKVQDVMPVHDLETAAPVLTNKQLGGFLIMHGFKNTLYNMRMDRINASRLDFHNAEGAAGYGSAIAKTTGRVALQAAMFSTFALLGKLSLGAGQQKDETKGQWVARTMLGGQTDDLPLVGGLGELGAKLAVGEKLDRHDLQSYSNPGVAAVSKAYETLGRMVNENREPDKKVFDALEAALFYSGLPSRAARTSGEHMYNLLMGEDYDGADDPAGRFVYTDRQWDSIKRTLTPDDED